MREVLVPGTIDGSHPEVGEALWRLEDTRRRTLSLLRELPAEHLEVGTHGNTIGTILYHLALIEADWLYSEILEEPYSEAVRSLLPADDRDQAGILTLIRGQTLEQHLSRLASIRTTLLERMRGMTPEDFHRERSLPSYDVSPAWVLHHLSQHEAEHRGEIGSIMTLLKPGRPPGMPEVEI